jgi:hypothetical protein
LIESLDSLQPARLQHEGLDDRPQPLLLA